MNQTSEDRILSTQAAAKTTFRPCVDAPIPVAAGSAEVRRGRLYDAGTDIEKSGFRIYVVPSCGHDS